MMEASVVLASVLRETIEPCSAHSDTPEEEGRQEVSQGSDGCSDETSRSDESADDSLDNIAKMKAV